MWAPRYPATPGVRRVQPSARHSTTDIVVTVIVFAVAALAGLGLIWGSFFFALAADSCQSPCDGSPITWAYLVTWGGTAIAAVIAVVGVTIAAARGRLMWLWPTLALGLIVVAGGAGVLLVNSFMSRG